MKNYIYRLQFDFWELLPIGGSMLFSLLYIVAALYYPGGNFLDKSAHGFSWTQNYWCNLLNENAINGQHNPARLIAFAAMFILCLTLINFWYKFPKLVNFKAAHRYIIQVSGIAAAVMSIFIFTGFHDTIINIAGLFGLIALAGTLLGLRKLGWTRLFYMGLFVVLLVGFNNLLYYNSNLIHYLPVVQKITFLYFLLWLCLINLRWYNRTGTKLGFDKPVRTTSVPARKF